MAGFWHLSHHQMRDPNGAVYDGARATFTEAATSNTLTVYQDYGLGTPHPTPVVANAYGVFPPVFFDEDDGFYRQRITTKNGLLIPGTDVGTLPIIGPGVGGGGSEVPVDPNSLLQTGDVIWLDQSGTRAGFVRDNGRTIGSATSGASERANADCEALYLFLFSEYSDTICPVTGGRSTAAADWAANKPIGLPDKRGYVPGGLDDMGNSAASRFTNVPIVSGSVTTAGSIIGAAVATLSQANLPDIAFDVAIPAGQGSHTHSLTNGNPVIGGSGGFGFQGGSNAGSVAISAVASTLPAMTGTADSGGSGSALNTTPLTVLGTWYRKL